jgi:hypothetical protein
VVLLGALVAITVTLTWWLICRRLPRVGALGSIAAIAYFTVGLFRERNNCIFQPVAHDQLSTVLAVAPLLASAIALAIAVTRWSEVR